MTAAATGVDEPCFVGVKFEAVIVAGFISSEKVASTLTPAGTPVAPGAGVLAVTVGLVVAVQPAVRISIALMAGFSTTWPKSMSRFASLVTVKILTTPLLAPTTAKTS